MHCSFLFKYYKLFSPLCFDLTERPIFSFGLLRKTVDFCSSLETPPDHFRCRQCLDSPRPPTGYRRLVDSAGCTAPARPPTAATRPAPCPGTTSTPGTWRTTRTCVATAETWSTPTPCSLYLPTVWTLRTRTSTSCRPASHSHPCRTTKGTIRSVFQARVRFRSSKHLTFSMACMEA